MRLRPEAVIGMELESDPLATLEGPHGQAGGNWD